METYCSRPTIHAATVVVTVEPEPERESRITCTSPCWVTNISDVNVLVYVAPRLDDAEEITLLMPGESLVMRRIDRVAPNYHVLSCIESEFDEGSVWIVAGPYRR